MNAFTLTEGSAAAGRSWNERVDWDAVTGITTVLAATAAVIAGALAIRVFLHDRAKAEAEQASQVAVWPVFQPFKGDFRWMTCLTNTSQLPVYDWWLEYEVETEKPAGVWTVHTKKNWLNERCFRRRFRPENSCTPGRSGR